MIEVEGLGGLGRIGKRNPYPVEVRWYQLDPGPRAVAVTVDGPVKIAHLPRTLLCEVRVLRGWRSYFYKLFAFAIKGRPVTGTDHDRLLHVLRLPDVYHWGEVCMGTAIYSGDAGCGLSAYWNSTFDGVLVEDMRVPDVYFWTIARRALRIEESKMDSYLTPRRINLTWNVGIDGKPTPPAPPKLTLSGDPAPD